MTIVIEGFFDSALQTGKGLGIPGLRIAQYPGQINVHSPEQIRKNVKEVLLAQIVEALTEPIAEGEIAGEPGPREIVFKGTFEEVNQHFRDNQWSDGLPIVPPTTERVEEFLKYTDYSPDERVAVLEPSGQEATIWGIAVNGVMAGCRPEYMPVLIAIAEVMADPAFQLRITGTTGGVGLPIILNGPIIEQLGFYTGVAELRSGKQANASVGRFLALYWRNGAGFLPGLRDMGCFGRYNSLVIVEDEANSPWEPLSVTRGFKPGTSTVTVASESNMSFHDGISGATAEEVLEAVAASVKLYMNNPEVVKMWKYCMKGVAKPLVVLVPPIANAIAEGGYSKKDVQEYLYEYAKIPASEADYYLKKAGQPSACDHVKAGSLPAQYCETPDPERLVPLTFSPDDFQIIVSGHLTGFRMMIFQGRAETAAATTAEIRLPANWDELMAELGK